MTRRQILFLFGFLCLGHVLLISAQVQSSAGVPVLQGVAFGAFSSLQRLTSAVADGTRTVWTTYFALSGVARENDALRAQIVDLQTQLQEQRAFGARARDLESLLALRNQQPFDTVPARVLAGSASPNVLTLTVDRGTADGIRPDMAVIESRGVVGRTIEPIGAHAATVQLLIGRNAAAAVVFERSQAGGLLLGGTVEPPLRAEYVPAAADVTIGERVTTSGQDGIYPPGLLVGTVRSVTRSTGPDRVIGIAPAVDFSHVAYVVVVRNAKPAEESPTR